MAATVEEMLGRLDPLVGTWAMAAQFPGQPPTDLGGARTTFAWLGRLLVQRTDLPHDGPPSSLTVITYDEAAAAYRQHYFDSRGVVRLYAMTWEDRVWTLLRTTPDFSPLDFGQRFVGELSGDGGTITAVWEKSPDGSWEHDFAMTYTRLA